MPTKYKRRKTDFDLTSQSIWSEDPVLGTDKKTRRKKTAYLLFNLILVLAILILGAAYFMSYDQQMSYARESNSIKQKVDQSQKELKDQIDSLQKKITDMEASEKEKAEVETKTGFIEGSMSYPANYIPATVSVCAEDVKTRTMVKCTTEQIYGPQFKYNVGYRLEVPAGKYYVYSTDPSIKDYKAYFSKFVNCNTTGDCTSHDPVEVTVAPDQTTKAIDPIDWYYNR